MTHFILKQGETYRVSYGMSPQEVRHLRHLLLGTSRQVVNRLRLHYGQVGIKGKESLLKLTVALSEGLS